MKNGEMIVKRCGGVGEGKPPRWFALPDEAACHTWSKEPAMELTELGPIEWWTCTRCPARTLHDPETDDGFAKEPIVVYPGSCFTEDEIAPGRAMLDPFQKLWTVLRVGAAEDEAKLDRLGLRLGDGPLVVLQAGAGGTLTARASILDGWMLLPMCPCPRRADGQREHLDGCSVIQAAIEEHLRELDEEAGFTGPLSLAVAAEPLHPVHDPADEEDGADLVRAFRNTPRAEFRCDEGDHAPADGDDGSDWMPMSGGTWLCPEHYAEFEREMRGTDPAPPSEEPQRAIADAEDVIPTERLPLLPVDA